MHLGISPLFSGYSSQPSRFQHAPMTYQRYASTSDTSRFPPAEKTFFSDKGKHQPPDDLWSGLYATYERYPFMGADDHDDWVAGIKAAMSGLGQSPLSVFDEVAATGQGYNITMKDGFKLHISHKELTQAGDYAKFSGNDAGMVKDARFMFAVMIKRKHVEAELDQEKIGYRIDLHKKSFGATLQAADDGIGGHAALTLLGLGYQLQHVWSQTAGNQVAVPAMKVFGHKRGMIKDGAMESYGHKQPVPKWIESFIVLKEPPRSPPPLAPTAAVKPFTFELDPEPDAEVETAKALPDLSSKRNGQKPDDPLLGFHTQRPYGFQGETATHADVIKLLMSRFGQSPTDVFSRVTFTDNSYQVTFRDGFELQLSRAELELASEQSLFLGKDEGLLKDAHFIFAAYIKRQQLQPPRPSFGLSFEAALEGNLHGRTVKNILEGMGVTRSIKYVERAGDAEGLVLMIGSNAGGLFQDGLLAKEGKILPEQGATQTHGYQLV